MKEKKVKKLRFRAPLLNKIDEDRAEKQLMKSSENADRKLGDQKSRKRQQQQKVTSSKTPAAIPGPKPSIAKSEPKSQAIPKRWKKLSKVVKEQTVSKPIASPEKPAQSGPKNTWKQISKFVMEQKSNKQTSPSPDKSLLKRVLESARANPAKPTLSPVEQKTQPRSTTPGPLSPQPLSSTPPLPAKKIHCPKDLGKKKGTISMWDRMKFAGHLPDINRKGSWSGTPTSNVIEEDVLALPFGGSRKLSDSNLLAAQDATNVIYEINQARKKRLKESINAEIAAVQDRVRKALEHSDIYEEGEDGPQEESMFDTRSRRDTMKFRNEMVYRLREHIEECHQRMVLITDVNNWIQIQQKDIEKELVPEEAMEEETLQYEIGHKKIMYSLDALTDCTSKVSLMGQKLLEMAGSILNSSKVKVEKIHVIDEKTMLTNKPKWDQAVSSIVSLFDDASRWVKGAQYKSALRNGKKQYQVILSAVDKRLAELADMSKLAEDLQNKLLMSKEMINKYCKDANDNKLMVDRLSKELSSLQSQMSLTLEANKKLTGQLDTLEGRVREMKAELAKPPPPPPKPPSPPPPPPPPPPQASESSKMLLDQTRQQMALLETQLAEYRMLVNNLSAKIDELEDQLSKEQKRVKFLKDSLDNQPVYEPRPPEPKVEVPAQPAPPPEVASDNSGSYYKTLLAGMKKDFLVEVEKLKDHLKREQSRNDAGVRRIEQGHKDQIQTILKDCMRVLRAIVHFRDQVSLALEKEGFHDSARQLQQLPKLLQENMSQDPKDILLYMAGNTVDYLHSMEVVLNHTMLAIKVMQKSGSVGSHPPVSQDQVFKQMEERMEEIRQPSRIRQVMKSPVKRVKSKSRRKDRQSIKKLQGMVSQFENKYVGLLDRYKLVWKLYNEQKRDMDSLQSDFEHALKRKVQEKENMVVSAIKTELKERRAENEQQLALSIADQKKNLQLLDRAFDDNKITRELHGMATSLLNQAMEIPRKRFRYMIERYIAHCAVKEAENKVTAVLQEESLTGGQRAEILSYMDQMQSKLVKGLSQHHQTMQTLDSDRRGIFRNIWNLFNEVLVDTGVLLIQPVFVEAKRETYTQVRLQKRRKVKAILGTRRRQILEMPKGLVGNNIPLAFKMDRPMWKQQPPKNMTPEPAVNTPVFLEMDVNRQRLLAKRNLKAGPRMHYPISQSRSFTICNKIQVDYISATFTCP